MQTHNPVLMKEVLEGLNIIPDGIYIDCTFGRGGHSLAILDKLNQDGRLIAIDKDLTALKHAKENFADDSRFQIMHGSFNNIGEFARDLAVVGKVNGILMDLGVSSPQIDDPARGFSFISDGPLDMRMNVDQKLDAKIFVNNASESEMTQVFREYGEERFAARIAKAIVVARSIKPILTTLELAEIVKEANPKWEKHKHPATRVFQAIRIHVNQELTDLVAALDATLDVLAKHGRLAVISFHSLEDRIVKQFMKRQEQGEKVPHEVPLRFTDMKSGFIRIGKAIKPLMAEVQQNIRARSAILRIGEKLK